MRLYWIRVRLNPIFASLGEEARSHREIEEKQTQRRRPHKGGGRDGRDAAISQGTLKPPETRRDRKDSLLEPSEEAQPY